MFSHKIATNRQKLTNSFTRTYISKITLKKNYVKTLKKRTLKNGFSDQNKRYNCIVVVMKINKLEIRIGDEGCEQK